MTFAVEDLLLRSVSASSGTCIDTVVTVVPESVHADGAAARLHKAANLTRKTIANNRELLPRMQVIRAVNGKNRTEVTESLRRKGLAFGEMSKNNAKRSRWNVLGSWLTHYNSIAHQVEHAIPWQLTVEDDVVLRPSFPQFLGEACAAYEKQPDTTLMQLSLNAEMRLQSLAGARHLLRLLKEEGARRVVDQQFLDPRFMGNKHTVMKYHKWRTMPRAQRPFATPGAYSFCSEPPWWVSSPAQRINLRTLTPFKYCYEVLSQSLAGTCADYYFATEEKYFKCVLSKGSCVAKADRSCVARADLPSRRRLQKSHASRQRQ